ncbi:MAG TPA: hypothetical protein VN200_05930 [Rhodoglobus sp.]|nr:hypothetical protein [Rhodoglobus sp.]
MSKKIDRALKDLKKALNQHAEAVGGNAVSLKKAQRATAKVAAAASAYAEAVHAKSGLGNPFDEMLQPGLEDSTLDSLKAEREAIKRQRKGGEPADAAAVADTGAPAEPFGEGVAQQNPEEHGKAL